MLLVSLLAIGALVIAGVSLTRLSRLPVKLPPVEERSYETLRAGDVVVTPKGDFLVTANEAQGPARLISLESGRERRVLWASGDGPVTLLSERPRDEELARAAQSGGNVALRAGAAMLDRSTVELLPGG